MAPNNLFIQAQALLHTPDPPGLGPGPRAHVESVTRIQAKADAVFREYGLPARTAELLRALALLWHDHLHAAHLVVQGIDDADANLIHAIVHRREPDYWNAKYWLRRVGKHPCFQLLAGSAGLFLASDGQTLLRSRLLPQGAWDPLAFVEFCQETLPLPESAEPLMTAIILQRLEFDALLRSLCQGTEPAGERAESANGR